MEKGAPELDEGVPELDEEEKEPLNWMKESLNWMKKKKEPWTGCRGAYQLPQLDQEECSYWTS